MGDLHTGWRVRFAKWCVILGTPLSVIDPLLVADYSYGSSVCVWEDGGGFLVSAAFLLNVFLNFSHAPCVAFYESCYIEKC